MRLSPLLVVVHISEGRGLPAIAVHCAGEEEQLLADFVVVLQLNAVVLLVEEHGSQEKGLKLANVLHGEGDKLEPLAFALSSGNRQQLLDAVVG